MRLPDLEAADFAGCDTLEAVTVRLAAILSETDSLIDLAEAPGDFEPWIQAFAARVPEGLSTLLAGVSQREVLSDAAEFLAHRSDARTKGLPALDLGHDGNDVIRVELPRDFKGSLIISIATERLDADVIAQAIEDEDRRLMRSASYNWSPVRGIVTTGEGPMGDRGKDGDRSRKA